MLVALAGGVGAARFLEGLVQVTDPSEVTAVVNTGDDFVLHGLHISPDLDTVTYTLAGAANRTTGWGLATESWRVLEALERLGGETWFRLGDRDLATHLRRTGLLRQGASLSQVTAQLARRWGVGIRLLPMSDDPVRTRLRLAATAEMPLCQEVSFQDYFVRLGHSVPVTQVLFDGASAARPAPGVLEALHDAEHIIVCPSNPILSIGPILAIREVRAALVDRRTDVVAISPIVAGATLKGPADHLLSELGHDASVVGVARLYADVAATLVIDVADANLAAAVQGEGVRCIVAPTIMSTRRRARALAHAVLHADTALR